jgi:hypothetical protein
MTSDMSLGWALRFDLWYELGPNFMSQLLVWAIPFMGLFHIPISPPPKGQESRNRIKNHTSLIFSENIKNPKTKTIPHLIALFEIPHGFFFLCLRERERVGFRVGWFKRECYSEKLRESVIVRY